MTQTKLADIDVGGQGIYGGTIILDLRSSHRSLVGLKYLGSKKFGFFSNISPKQSKAPRKKTRDLGSQFVIEERRHKKHITLRDREAARQDLILPESRAVL